MTASRTKKSRSKLALLQGRTENQSEAGQCDGRCPTEKKMERAEQAKKAEQLRKLHHGQKILVMANAWDAISARLVEETGFPAVATTSAGVAAMLGYPDGKRVTRDQMLGGVARIARGGQVSGTAELGA